MSSWFYRLSIVALAFLFVACSSSEKVANEYLENIQKKSVEPQNLTVLCILVDGLSYHLLKDEMPNLPNITKYFGITLYRAQTVFPSETFPAITSLLTGRPVDRVLGNQMFLGDELVDFESPMERNRLKKLVEDQSIFHRLEAKGLTTMSLSYAFGHEAKTHIGTLDLTTGLDVLDDNYEALDGNLIDNLHSVLQNRRSATWPSFIFLHPVGIDFLSHKKGPDSKEVKNYLRRLDQEFSSVFKDLERAEKKEGHKTLAILTADHGFDYPIHTTLELDEDFKSEYPSLRQINSGKHAAFYFPAEMTPKARRAFLQKRLRQDGVQLSILRVNEKDREAPLEIHSKTQLSAVQLKNFKDYFKAKAAPEAILVTTPGNSFSNISLGQHGAISVRESQVPLLFHGAQLGDPSQVPMLYDLLKFVEP